METRPFGRTGYASSVIGFGGGSVSGEGGGYGFGPMTTAEAVALMQAALDMGITLFDTAPIYGFGESERRIGAAFSHCRDRVYLVSKSGVTWDGNRKTFISNDPVIAGRMLRESLERLQTSYIDLYMIHWPDSAVDIRRTMEVLAEAKRRGQIRAIGLSNTNAEDIARAEEIAPVDVIQGEFNALKPGVRDRILPLCREKNLGFMSWGTLEKGILSGRVTEGRTFDPLDARSRAPWWTSQDHAPAIRAVGRLADFLKPHGHTTLEFALGWVLSHKDVSTALCGARNLDQLRTLCAAAENLPGADLLKQGEALLLN